MFYVNRFYSWILSQQYFILDYSHFKLLSWASSSDPSEQHQPITVELQAHTSHMLHIFHVTLMFLLLLLLLLLSAKEPNCGVFIPGGRQSHSGSSVASNCHSGSRFNKARTAEHMLFSTSLDGASVRWWCRRQQQQPGNALPVTAGRHVHLTGRFLVTNLEIFRCWGKKGKNMRA